MNTVLQVLMTLSCLAIAAVVLLVLDMPQQYVKGGAGYKPSTRYVPRHSAREEPPQTAAQRAAQVPTPPSGTGGGSHEGGSR